MEKEMTEEGIRSGSQEKMPGLKRAWDVCQRGVATAREHTPNAPSAALPARGEEGDSIEAPVERRCALADVGDHSNRALHLTHQAHDVSGRRLKHEPLGRVRPVGQTASAFAVQEAVQAIAALRRWIPQHRAYSRADRGRPDEPVVSGESRAARAQDEGCRGGVSCLVGLHVIC